MLALRDACLVATEETGKQLWGPARFAEYRVALDAPAPLAAGVLEPGVVRFGLGPLTEVIAQHHAFAALEPHLDAAVAPIVAQERVLRGEDLRDRQPDGREGFALDPFAPPLTLTPFEPAYVLPTYGPDERLDGDPTVLARRVEHGEVAPVRPTDASSAGAARRTLAALGDLVTEWTSRSSGRVRSAACIGSASDALARVVDAPARWWRLALPDLLAELARAGASGGVHGRRRGGAAGRAGAWWVGTVATGLDRGAGMDPDELEFRMEDLELVGFEVLGAPRAAWRLGVALADPAAGWAVAIEATDDGDADGDADGERAAARADDDGDTDAGGRAARHAAEEARRGSE
ncbi:MAG: hypothetical protein RLZZ272_583 [Actinomycetota bacterium]